MMSKRGPEPGRTHYIGSATISDGTTESSHFVEIHVRTGENAVTPAWHVVVKDSLPKELRSSYGKTLSVRIATGVPGVGTLVDPRLIRGTGEPPFG